MIACAFLLALSGCESPSKRWALASEAVSAASTSLVDLHKSGELSDEEFAEAAPFLLSASDELLVAYSYLPLGGDAFDRSIVNVSDATARAESVLTQRGETKP